MTELHLEIVSPRRIRVALSALVLGALALTLALIPGAAYVAALPALLGGLMAIHGIHRRVEDRWQAWAGLLLAPVAIAVAIVTITATRL